MKIILCENAATILLYQLITLHFGVKITAPDEMVFTQKELEHALWKILESNCKI